LAGGFLLAALHGHRAADADVFVAATRAAAVVRHLRAAGYVEVAAHYTAPYDQSFLHRTRIKWRCRFERGSRGGMHAPVDLLCVEECPLAGSSTKLPSATTCTRKVLYMLNASARLSSVLSMFR